MKNKPPKIAKWLLKKFLRRENRINRIDDLEEVYQNISQREGRFKAVKWYWSEVFGAIPQILTFSIYWSFAMFKNYLKTALRNIQKQKGYTFINITGLAIGLTCCIFIFIWVKDELSYDKYHINGDRVYRVLMEFPRTTRKIKISAYSGPRTSYALKEEFSGIEEALRFKILGNIKPNILVKHEERGFNEQRFAFGDPSLFKMFTYQFIKGNPDNPLPDKNSIILTEKISQKYFGDRDPIGKTLTVENEFDYTVTGVIKNVPKNSHLQFDLLVPFENIESIFTYYGKFLNSKGGPWFFRNYILLRENASLIELKDKVKNFYDKIWDNNVNKLYLQPVKEIQLYSSHIRDSEERGDILYISIFTLIGIFILLIACINFINLTTAQSGLRSKEIGMRKVLGATRKNLLRQFFTETLVFSFIALISALCLVSLLMPYFSSISGKELAFNFRDNLIIAASIITITLAAGLLSGIYPALFLSGLKPLRILKGLYGSEKRGSFLRKAMVVLQFVIAVSLIICTLIVFHQFMYIQNRDLGFDKEHFIYFQLYGKLKEKYEIARNEFLKHPDIPAATVSSSIMSQAAYATDFLGWDGKNEDITKAGRMSFVSVEKNYIETFNLEIVKGSSFSKGSSKLMNEEIIVNETAAKIIGIDPIIGLGARVPGPNKGRIIGVVKDYHYTSLHQEIGPLVMSIEPPVFRYFLIKIKPENMQSALNKIEEICKEIEPGFPFEYHFMDEAFEKIYKSESKMRDIILIFTLIAIFIACLGLVGLSSFTAERRTKEICIRKVFGAKVNKIVLMLSYDFLKCSIIAAVIAIPMTFYIMNNWLQNFAYRVTINPWIYVLSLTITVILTFITVCYYTVKAAISNPVNSLRNE
ncbi:ABC transporter permease [candidate division KSB1 bacterium]